MPEEITAEKPKPISSGCAVASLGSVHTIKLAEYLDALEARIVKLEEKQVAAESSL